MWNVRFKIEKKWWLLSLVALSVEKLINYDKFASNPIVFNWINGSQQR